MREIGLIEVPVNVTAGRRYLLQHPKGTRVRDGGTVTSPTIGPLREPQESGEHRLLVTSDLFAPATLTVLDLGSAR